MLSDRKTPTTKDLSKPWSSPSLPPHHSAHSTLLLDDSPSKALLQPYNHLRVPPYSGSNHDDRTLLAIIGVLDHVRHESNVAAWMRAGGLSRCAGEVREGDEGGEVWFEHGPTFAYWVGRGEEALGVLGIAITK